MSGAFVLTCDRCSFSDTEDAGWGLFSLIESPDEDPWDLCPDCSRMVTDKPRKECGCGNDGCFIG